MPHFGQLPGSGAPTSGCIGHTNGGRARRRSRRGGGRRPRIRPQEGSRILDRRLRRARARGMVRREGSNAPERTRRREQEQQEETSRSQGDLRGRAAHSGRKRPRASRGDQCRAVPRTGGPLAAAPKRKRSEPRRSRRLGRRPKRLHADQAKPGRAGRKPPERPRPEALVGEGSAGATGARASLLRDLRSSLCGFLQQSERTSLSQHLQERTWGIPTHARRATWPSRSTRTRRDEGPSMPSRKREARTVSGECKTSRHRMGA
jgi:hypothetical protein